MKAIRVHEFGGPEVLKLEEVPDPEPGQGQVLLEVHAVGVNPVDTYIRAGTYTFAPPLPYTPGMDAAGVVCAAGQGVTRLREGDRAYAAGTLSGAYAGKSLCPQEQVFRLPDTISYAQGAAIGIPYGTAYRALFQRAKAAPGETVLIHGATGGVGIAAVQLARAAGLTVLGTGGSDKGRRLVTEQGAHHVLDHHQPGHLEQALALTEGRGIDVILEMLADVNLGNDLPILARGGRVVVIGSRGEVQINPRDTMTRDAAILGMTLMNLTQQDRTGIHAALAAGMENGTLRPIVGAEMPLEDAPKAHHAVLESSAHGKIVLVP